MCYNDPSRAFLVRLHAVLKLRDLLRTAIDRGYAGIAREECCRLARQAKEKLKSSRGRDATGQIRAVDDLASHLSQAVADGFYGELPDF